MAELDNVINEPSEAEVRIKQLSGQAKKAQEEREAEKTAREAAEAKTAEAERKVAFAEGFTDVVATNPAAKEFKADIQAKVMSGYSMEDATFAVLGKAGKLNQAPAETQAIAGGSASNTITNTSEKSIDEMTQAERRALLVERESELQAILSPRRM